VHNSLYRIAQEALNNVGKHSQATQASITLQLAGGSADLSVSDNGRGFDPDKVTGEHLGLTIMRERADEIGADLRIESTPGCGTCVCVHWEPRTGEDN
jgi:signal transduction histidine kinase